MLESARFGTPFPPESPAMITDGSDLIDPAHYGAHGYPHETWARLRAEAPVYRCAPAGFEAFWAISRHADICEISKRPDLFLNREGPVLLSDAQKRDRDERLARGEAAGFNGMRTIIEMDPPEHRSFRGVSNAWFTPNRLRGLDALVEESARNLVDELATRNDEVVDFVKEISARHPLRILCRILGVEEKDEPFLLRVTNELFGSDDPEFQRAGDRRKATEALGLEMYQFFSKIIEDRRAHPRPDLASLLANAEIDSQPMGPMETFGYFLIVFTAGHETTRNAITGGAHALIENHAERQKLRDRPSLAASAVEEIVRFSTPVNYMKRTVAKDMEFRGQSFRKGEQLVLFYASANRDEEIFEAPKEFRIERSPNRHLGFGIGEHFCLGANLARKTSRALFRELVGRLDSAELAGEPEQVVSSFVAGFKHLPVRLSIAPAAEAPGTA